jgi:mRNA interferase RelE/StbE
LKRYANMAARIRRAIEEYAADPAAHANNVAPLVGLSGRRMRVGDYRVVFEEIGTEIQVTRVGSRGDIYD